MADEGRGRSWPSELLILPEAPDRLFALFPRRGVLSNTILSNTIAVEAGSAPERRELSVRGSR
jgi:hypothetical protein